jgi:hypothetical protein
MKLDTDFSMIGGFPQLIEEKSLEKKAESDI